LAIVIGILALNVWTGSPLLALWIASRVQGDGPPQMGPLFLALLLFGVFSFSLAYLLGRVTEVYDRHTGHVPTVRAHAPWLRSLRGERENYPGARPSLSAPERIIVIMVMAAVLAFEVWFFFFSTSPIDQRTGRSDAGLRA
jgi:hypothetical protein